MEPITLLNHFINSAIPYAWDDSESWMEFLGKVLAKVNELVAASNTYFDFDYEAYAHTTISELLAQAQAFGQPMGQYATVAELTLAHPNGGIGAYFVQADSRLYYWDTSAWVAGGLYNIANADTVNIIDTPNYFTGSTVEAALEELGNKVKLIGTDVIVKAGGTVGTDCDFTSLSDAVTYAYNHPIGGLTIRILAGTYDIITELGVLVTQGFGLQVGNGMHLIFSPQAYVVCNYLGGNPSVAEMFSPFNAGDGDFIFEGMNISCSNVHYCVHDELYSAAGFRRHEYRNCTMYLDNSASNSATAYWACIGGGLGNDEQVIIDGGRYESATRDPGPIKYGSSITFHNGHLAGAKSEIIVKNVRFVGQGSGVRFGYYGVSTLITKCFVSNCRMGVPPKVMNETGAATPVNMELVAWGNETDSILAPLLNGWLNYESGNNPTAYWLTGNNVHLQGLIIPTNATSPVILKIPEGLRPGYDYRFPCQTNAGTVAIVVTASGEVGLENPVLDKLYYDLSCIRFPLYDFLMYP